MINPTVTQLGYDVTFEIDNFSRPRLCDSAELIKNVIMYIIFTKRGQHPSLPQIGLDIESMLYSFYDEIDEEDLKEKIISQCQALNYYFATGAVNILKTTFRGKPSLVIHIETSIDGVVNMGYEDHTSAYQIGITFDDLDKMIYKIEAIST